MFPTRERWIDKEMIPKYHTQNHDCVQQCIYMYSTCVYNKKNFEEQCMRVAVVLLKDRVDSKLRS